jgi:hypothetical protein
MDKAKQLAALLRDTAQSASNAIASNVSGPVDLLSMGLKGIGLPMPQNPVGGSQWMADKGLTRDVPMGAPRIIGETLGMAGPALATNFAPQIARGALGAMDNLSAPATMNKQAGVIAFPDYFTQPEKVAAVKKHAEDFVDSLKARGLRGSVEHSGSRAGPSSYVKVHNPVTGAGVFDNTPFRFSDHSKGPVQSQYVREIRGSHDSGLNIGEYDDYLNSLAKVTPEQQLAYDTRVAQYLKEQELYNSPLEVAARNARKSVFKAYQEARNSGADFIKVFSNSGKPLF